ncbi:hypothetical protein [Calothrix sp. PCC 7507]|uniref:hypothetical protein n=1 Tax=Calothrix sp. PCC 7507 TaxID=99598 RepID=UPI00029ECDC2|nr:hypothetical protein [Calothrix sp. PCC 7507]AFY33963.1 hypothetical protein Cal7507_3571 [Calothrix sp. PCC 7507]
MSHFNYKSLTFYGVAIASVLLLFKTVTVYGENNLKTAPTISDRYLLKLTENLPNCEQPEDLTLNIQQSGIYVNASLLPANNNTTIAATNQNKHSLSGLLSNQQLNLSGKIDRSNFCKTTPSQKSSVYSATMQMQLKDKSSVTGQLTINSIPQTLGFTAIAQTAKEESQKSKSH